MSEVVIIGGSNILTASDSQGTENHLRHGAENDDVTLVRGSWRDIHDMFDDAVKLGTKYAIHQFVVAPYEPMSREFMLRVALPLLAKEFRFNPIGCCVVEHTKDRADVNAFNIHWHVVVPYFDPDNNGAVGKRWWQDFQRHELSARILEYKQWVETAERDPSGPKFVRGRFHNANIDTLCGHEDPEMQAIGAALEAKLPRGTAPEATAPADNVVRMHKRQGRDIIQLRKICREAWRASTTDEEFRRLMEAEGLFVTLAEEPPPKWMIANDTTVLGTLAGMVHAKKDEVINRMGDPQHDDWYAGAAGRAGRAEDVEHVGAHRDAARVVEVKLDILHEVAPEPGRRDYGDVTPGLFVAALERVDASRLDTIVARAVRLARTATGWALRYFNAAEEAAKRYLAGRKADLPKVSDDLARLRAKSEKYADDLRATEEAYRASKEAYDKAWPDPLTENPTSTMKEVERDRERAGIARWKLLDKIEEHNKERQPFEAAYEAETERYRAAKAAQVKENEERAQRYIRVATRCRALIEKFPRVLWVPPEAIFARGVLEDQKAPPTARWLVDPPLPPPAEDDIGFKPPGSIM